MKKKHNLKLIKGTFTPTQARSVLLELINSKIRYHNAEAFSMKEMFSGDVSHLENRVAELRETAKQVEEIISYTSGKGLHLKIDSIIEINFVK